MTDVCLIYPPNWFKSSGHPSERTVDIPLPPLGILYLASALERNGIAVKIIDAVALSLDLNEITKIIDRENPRLVGISANTIQIRGANQLATKLKEEFGNEIVIGLGGVHETVDPKFVIRFPCFDFGLVGEAEITFPKLVRQVLSGETVKGIYYGETPSNLDDIPFPARHLINKRHYFMPGEECALILANRGCPFNCIFCSSVALGRKVRYRSPANIVNEMEEIADDYNRNFWFVDDTMTVNRKHTLQLCDEIIRRKLDVTWSCSTRVDMLDRKLLEVMYKAGCKSISLGVESGSERIRRKIIKKNFGNEEIFRVFKLCKEVGIETDCFFMLGFPTETIHEIYQTVKICTRIDATGVIGVHLTSIMPGSDLFRYAIAEGVVPKNIFDRYAKGELKRWPIYVPKGLSLNDLRKARREAYRRYYFRPQFMFKRLVHILGSTHDLRRDVRMFLSLVRRGGTFGEASEWNIE